MVNPLRFRATALSILEALEIPMACQAKYSKAQADAAFLRVSPRAPGERGVTLEAWSPRLGATTTAETIGPVGDGTPFVLLSANPLRAFLRRLPKGEVIRVEQMASNRVLVDCEGERYATLLCLEGQTAFPTQPTAPFSERPATAQFALSAEECAGPLAFVRRASFTANSGRPKLENVAVSNLISNLKSVALVATNGPTMHVSDSVGNVDIAPEPKSPEEDREALIPYYVADLLIKFGGRGARRPGPGGCSIEVWSAEDGEDLTDNQTNSGYAWGIANLPGARLWFTLPPERWCNWRRVIPSTHDGEFIARRPDLIEGVKSVAIGEDDRYRNVEFSVSVSPYSLRLVAGATSCTVPISSAAETPSDNTFVLKSHYVLRVLKAMESDGVRVEYRAHDSAVVLREHGWGSRGQFALIMPVAPGYPIQDQGGDAQ